MSVKIADKIVQYNNGSYFLMDSSAVEYIDKNGDSHSVKDILDNGTGGTVDLSEYTKTYTTIGDLGLTAPVTVGEIFNAMPNNTMAMIACEGTKYHITDIPGYYGILTIKRVKVGRFSIEFQSSSAVSATDVKRWIGTLKGTDGTELTWKLISTQTTYTTLSDIGLTADATVEDVVNVLKNGESFLAPVNTFTNYETIFPNRVPNDQWNKIHIVKGTSLPNSHIRCYSQSGACEYLANVNNTNIVSWNDVSGAYIDISDAIIEKLGTEILKYPVGKYRINSTATGNKFTDLPSNAEMKCGLIEINGTAVDKSPFTDAWVYRMYKFECLTGTLSYVRRLNSGATTGKIELDTGWQKDGQDIYTALSSLGLTAPITVGEIFNAMPDKTTAVIACEGKEGNTDGVAVHVSDVPVSYGVLTIKKNTNARFSIEYQNSLQGSPCNVKRWIGTLKGSDGTGLYWRQLSAEPTFVTLNDIGLAAYATFQDVVDTLPKGGSALLGVKEFTNYQTIFPYEDGNDQFARVYIVKGWDDGSCVYAIWFRKDGSKEAIAIFNKNDNKFNGWKVTSGNLNIISEGTITKYGTEILKYPVGTWRIGSLNIGKRFTDLPLTEMACIIEIDSIYPTKSPYEHDYAYRNYTIRDALTNNIYIRSLNSRGTAGTIERDTGWQQIQISGCEYHSINQLNSAKGTSIELVNGEDNTQKIMDALGVGDSYLSLYHNDSSKNRFGISTSIGNRINRLHIEKILDANGSSNYCVATAIMNTGVVLNRTNYGGTLSAWIKTPSDARVTTLETQVSELFQSVSDGKKSVANAITGKGVSTSTTATFATMATNISKIPQTITWKEETVSASPDSNTHIARFVFSNTVLGVKQMVAPGYHYTAEVTETKMFTINSNVVEVHLDSGTWKMTAMVRNT